jgi:hypothetical protein
VSRRTSPADRIEGRRVFLTLRATLRFGSLGFIYTGPAESIAGRTFARPPRHNVPTGAAGRAVFVRGFSGDTIMVMLGPNTTQEHFRLAAYYLTDLSFQASGAEPLTWGSSWSNTPPCTPMGSSASRTTQWRPMSTIHVRLASPPALR